MNDVQMIRCRMNSEMDSDCEEILDSCVNKQFYGVIPVYKIDWLANLEE